jgi:hypothetical protein
VVATDQRDNMVGDDNSNAMFAFGDNDVLTGKGSGDVMSGGVGDDHAVKVLTKLQAGVVQTDSQVETTMIK